MFTAILEVAGLLAAIIVPLRGPKEKKKTSDAYKIDTDVSHAHYAVDQQGNLVAIHGNELTNQVH